MLLLTEKRRGGGRERERDRPSKPGIQQYLPCYIPSVKRFILPVGRIWFPICHEDFCQSLNVFQPNGAVSSSSSTNSITSLTIRQRRERRFKTIVETFGILRNMQAKAAKPSWHQTHPGTHITTPAMNRRGLSLWEGLKNEATPTTTKWYLIKKRSHLSKHFISGRSGGLYSPSYS